MFKKSKVCSGVLIALGGVLLVSVAPSSAQERVEITGSRIKSLGAVSNSPISSITAEEINSSQPAAIEEVIRGLPSAVPAIGPAVNNGSGGGATIDLRGIGPQRTLVLVNGRRLVPFDLTARVDTNSIPVALLERVDVFTGGASAVYGADAVSGVVNFVLRKNFSGLEAATTYGISGNNDAKKFRSDFTVGANLPDGRGNVVLSVGSTRTQALTQGQREYGFFQLDSTTGGAGGSTTAVPAYFTGITNPDPTKPNPLGGSRVIDYTTGALRPAVASDQYNFNPPNYYQTPLERTQITALGNFVINEYADAYAELLNTKSKVSLQLAPSGSFTLPYTIPIGNPFMPDAMRAQLCTAYKIAAANCVVGNATPVGLGIRRRFVELGPRGNDFNNSTAQWTVGLRGAVPYLGSWSYDTYLQRGQADQVSARINWGSYSKLQQSLNSLSKTSCTNTSNNCVPIDIFGQTGSVSAAAGAFINLSGYQNTSVEQTVASLAVSGDLGDIKSPLSKNPIGLAFGAEQRKIVAGNASDGATQTQNEILGTGAPTPDRRGSIQLNEAFAEAQLPIADGLFGIHSLGLEAGYRSTEFKTDTSGKNYGSWKAGVSYAPVKGLRFRAMQQRATRAPNINELYAPVVTGLSGLATDPCQGNKINVADSSVPGTLSYLCRQTGVPASQVGSVSAPSAGQINNTGGGNPALGPEEADTTTLGLVWEPDELQGLSVTLDYYKISIKKAVSNATTTQVVNGCYTAALNPGFSTSAPFCGFISRNPLSGDLNGGLGVITQSSNLGAYDVRGLDISVKYRLPLKNFGLDSLGRIDFSLDATKYSKWDFKSLPTVDTLSCLGVFGSSCGGPTNRTKWNQRTNWNVGDFSVGYNWRYLEKTSLEVGDANANILPEYSSVPSVSYVDLSGSWEATKNLRVALAINNALGKKPPIVGNSISGATVNSGNTFPSWYDTVGRYYSLTARLKF
jgi:iron complex outermembrane recepter protein